MAITNKAGTLLNKPRGEVVERSMIPRSDGENAYQSKYWPVLNDLADDSGVLTSPWGQKSAPQSDRESTLLDIIGAYDLLMLQGLTAEKALTRLGLHKTRDDLVKELDSETARRLSILPASAPKPARSEGSL